MERSASTSNRKQAEGVFSAAAKLITRLKGVPSLTSGASHVSLPSPTFQRLGTEQLCLGGRGIQPGHPLPYSGLMTAHDVGPDGLTSQAKFRVTRLQSWDWDPRSPTAKPHPCSLRAASLPPSSPHVCALLSLTLLSIPACSLGAVGDQHAGDSFHPISFLKAMGSMPLSGLSPGN